MKIIGLLKKYIISIIVIVILLVIQAQCDLKLPEYTANIINVGIQSNGIEYAVPEVIREDSLDIISMLSGDNTITSYYDLIEYDNKNLKDIIEGIDEVNIYVLKDNVNKSELESILLKAEVAYSMLSTNKESARLLENKYAFKSLYESEEGSFLKDITSSVEKLDTSMVKQYAISYIISEYNTLKYDYKNNQINYLWKSGIKMILFSLFIMFVIIVTTYLSGKVASGFAYDLRNTVVDKVMAFSQGEYNSFSTASLITRCTNDIQQVQMFFTILLRMVLYAPIIGIGAVAKIFGLPLAWIIAVAIGSIVLLIMILLILVLPKFSKIQKLIDKVNSIIREQLNGLLVIRAFSNEKYEKDKFDNTNVELTNVNLFTNKLMALMSPVMNLVMNGTIVLIYWFGSVSIDVGSMQVGDLTAFISYTFQIIFAFLMFSMISIMGPRALISIKRIKEVLNTKITIEDPKESKPIVKSKKGCIEFKNVSFKYPDGEDLVLDDISFEVKKGETFAIIGSTGSGKSSIINLIPRFFDVTSGELIVNGVNVKDLKLKDLRDSIGVVPQKGLLFSGTIASNIKLSNDFLSDEEMIQAAKIACADEFINEREEKYEAPISQGGTNVSGGQKQRLAIARAIAKNPDIYIFDDSFSALDYKTDSKVRKNLNKYCKDATKLIVAQRVATVMNADKIMVLNEGKIVGIGTHKELYKNCKIYKEIALSQLKEDELV